MNIQDNTSRMLAPALQQQPSLPPLIKASTTYKLFVPRNVEEKIRYLIRKFPSTEWSGVLFYNHTGSFKQDDLEIHCQDIFPMDLGSGTFTDFKMDESVVGYIADNIDLFGCDIGLVHSHHQLGAFISGTDFNTIRSEGNDTNCFVSLVVDTRGTYVAALTRKIQSKSEVVTKSLGTSYEFFGEGTIKTGEDTMSESTQIIDKEVIEYFMLDIQVEKVDNPLAYLDTRFDEIEAKKKKAVVTPVTPTVNTSNNSKSPWIPNGTKIINPALRDFDEDYSFRDWQNEKKAAETKETFNQEPTLFSEEEMGKIDTSKWEPDPTIIHKLVCQMVTCSLIVSDNIDLKQWINRWMNKKYGEIFGPDGNESSQFNEWKEFIVEFMTNQYLIDDDDIPSEIIDDWELIQSKVASAIYTELYQYAPDGVNVYMDDYKEVLMRYIYE